MNSSNYSTWKLGKDYSVNHKGADYRLRPAAVFRTSQHFNLDAPVTPSETSSSPFGQTASVFDVPCEANSNETTSNKN